MADSMYTDRRTCPRCGLNFIAEDTDFNVLCFSNQWVIANPCPDCGQLGVWLLSSSKPLEGDLPPADAQARTIYPRSAGRPPVPPEVPTEFAADYEEACLILADSPRASAMLIRTCLQNILRAKAGVKAGNLADEIKQATTGSNLPADLVVLLDAVRQVGNLSAHPTTSQSTGELVPVEPEEAELCLEVIESLFEHFFVTPMRRQSRIRNLNEKLADAGKPLIPTGESLNAVGTTQDD